MRTADRTFPSPPAHTFPPDVPMGRWPAQLSVALEQLPTSAYTWDDADPAVVWDAGGDSPVLDPVADVLYEPFDNYTTAPWTVTGGASASIVAGRTATAAQITNSGTSISYDIPSAKQADTITVGFAINWSHGGISKVLSLRSDAGATEHNQLQLNSNNSLTFSRGTTGLATSAASLVTPGTWYYLEVQCKLHDTTGYVKVRLNGTEIINASALDTKNAGTKTVYDQVRFEMSDGRVNKYDDLYIATGPSAFFKGDITLPLPPGVSPYVWDNPQTPSSFIDAACDLIALELEAGLPDELGLMAATTATFTLMNPAGQYSAWTEDGRNVYFAPGRLVCLYATHAGAKWWIGRLRVDRWAENADGTVTVEASDGFSLLARDRAPFTVGVAGELPRARIEAICTAARFPDPVRGDLGDVTLTRQLTDTSPLVEIQRVALSDGGIVFCDADGALVYRNRAWHAGRSDQTRLDVFSDNVCDAPHVVWDCELADADDRLATDVHLTNVAGLTAAYTNPEGWNQLDYFYSHPDPDYWTLQNEGDQLAAAIVARDGVPRVGVAAMTLYLHDPNQDLWLVGLDRRIGDRVKFVHDFVDSTGATSTIEILTVVSTIRHEITAESWLVGIGTTRTVDYVPIERWDRTAYVWDDTDPLAVWRL